MLARTNIHFMAEASLSWVFFSMITIYSKWVSWFSIPLYIFNIHQHWSGIQKLTQISRTDIELFLQRFCCTNEAMRQLKARL